jgi:hypothetical protein
MLAVREGRVLQTRHHHHTLISRGCEEDRRASYLERKRFVLVLSPQQKPRLPCEALHSQFPLLVGFCADRSQGSSVECSTYSKIISVGVPRLVVFSESFELAAKYGRSGRLTARMTMRHVEFFRAWIGGRRASTASPTLKRCTLFKRAI